jgi:L-serine kinase (ATP) / ParB family transcriptional regulator, heme-responsive regulator
VIPSLRDLRLVDLGCLILHEAHDEDRLIRLRERMKAEGEQRNPVIVSPHEDRFLVLDGAHRVRALGEIGSPLALVQMVDPPEKAEGWAHLLGRMETYELRNLHGIEASEKPDHNPLAEIETADDTIFLSSTGEGLPGLVRALWNLQSLYPKGVVVHRVESQGAVRLSEGETLIRYRGFTPGELAAIVDSGSVLPAGITRFRVRERVLGVNYPLENMTGGNVDAQNDQLEEYVRGRWNEGRVRFYGEPVVLFE